MSKLVGAAGWVAPASVNAGVLGRVLAEGWIEPGSTALVGLSQLRRYRATDSGRAALEAASGVRT